MKILSLTIIGLIITLGGCTKQTNPPQIPTQKVIEKIEVKEEIPLPYKQESKFIKILILPFQDAENDIDYGGYIETKLEGSKFIFNDSIRTKLLEDNNIGGI
jgi:hypothetical protein